jgi:hypothetical protein
MPFTKVSNQLRELSQVCPVNKYRWVKFCLQREEASCWICSSMFQSRLSTNCQFARLFVPVDDWNAEYEHLQEAHRTSDHYSRQVSLRVSLSRLTNGSTVWLWLCVYYTAPNLSCKPYNRLMHTSASGIEQLKPPISSWGCY